MFKSIQWRLASMFALLVLAVMLVFGTVAQGRIAKFYYDNFKQQMNIAFSTELTDKIKGAAFSDNGLDEMKRLLDQYAGRMGINTDRNYYVLRKDTGAYLIGSDTETNISITDNIISAMAGKVGDYVETDEAYIDYAYPAGSYIIYVRDNKQEFLGLIRTLLGIVSQALLIGIIISMVLGFILSKTFTRPITNLTKKAERLAEGEYDSRIVVRSRDEIGKLGETFNYMAGTIQASVEKIAQEKNKLETMFRYMTDGVIAFDLHQNLIHTNPAAKQMLGIEDEQEILFDEFFSKLHANITVAEMVYLEYNSTIERDIEAGGKHLKAYFATFKNDDGKLSGIVVVIQDVTASQRLEISRREFVANVSHELRTPLTTIKMYSETMLYSAENEDEKKFLGVICREVDRMTRIVKDLLTLSSLDHNRLIMEKNEVFIDDLIYDVVTKLSFDAKNHNHKLTYNRAQLPKIFADRDRIEQVLTNVIANAIKYTPDGGKIDVYSGNIYNEVYIKIKDNGIGIPEKDLPRIFERFYRVDKARSRESGGTGLGLAIAQEIIELHGGSIKIQSENGNGTEVVIKIPAVKA